jgi:hypothetical protein
MLLELNILFDIQTRIANGFDDNHAFFPGNKPSSGTEDMILIIAGASDPDDAVLALDSHSILTVVQVQYLVGGKAEFDLWGC